MIRQLQRKFTLLVLLVLLVIFAGIVCAINFANYSTLQQQVDASLRALLSGDGRRPVLAIEVEKSMAIQDGQADEEAETLHPAALSKDPFPSEGEGAVVSPAWTWARPASAPGQPDSDPAAAANLSNFYSVRLTPSGAVLDWYSDRPELYDDQQVESLAAAAYAEGKPAGKIGSQYYMTAERPYGTVLVVLDRRLEADAAWRLLVASSLVGLAAYLLMGAGAMLLIRRMTQPVAQAFERQKQFVWDASHELKTPLAVISANAAALEGEVGESRWLDYIQSEVERTNHLVGNLLALARMDQAEQQVPKQSFDLSRAVLSAALPFESVAFETGKRLALEVTPDLRYTGNEEMLKQLTVILLDNALKYSDAGGVITLTLTGKGDRRTLRVHNTGGSIAQEDLPHIFERFYRADQSHNRESGGNGLGLAIAKTIVAAHNGKIGAESAPQQGTAFTVTL